MNNSSAIRMQDGESWSEFSFEILELINYSLLIIVRHRLTSETFKSLLYIVFQFIIYRKLDQIAHSQNKITFARLFLTFDFQHGQIKCSALRRTSRFKFVYIQNLG